MDDTKIIIELLQNINVRFDALEKRFVALEKRFDALENRVDEMEAKFDKRFDILEDKIAEHHEFSTAVRMAITGQAEGLRDAAQKFEYCAKMVG